MPARQLHCCSPPTACAPCPAPRRPAGFSASWGLSNVDPGFTYTPIFSVDNSVVTSLYPGDDGSCRSEFSTSSYYSHSDFKSSLSVQ